MFFMKFTDQLPQGNVNNLEKPATDTRLIDEIITA